MPFCVLRQFSFIALWCVNDDVMTDLGFVSLVEYPGLPAEGEAGLGQGPEVDEALAHGDDGAALQGVKLRRNHCLRRAFGLCDLRNDIYKMQMVHVEKLLKK